MTTTLPPDQRLSVDDAPLREWLSRTPQVWEKRLARHVITGESLGKNGISVGETIVRLSHRFSSQGKDDARQDAKLTHLLATCRDPRSAASVWLRAILPWFHNGLSTVEQLEVLTERLGEKLASIDDKEKFAWATLATRAGALLCKPKNRNQDMDEEVEHAMVNLLVMAWTAFPANLSHQGRSMLPADQGRTGVASPPWEELHRNIIAMFSYRKWHSRTPSALLPMQLWMAPDFDGLSLVDQQTAQTHHGLVPNSFIGHRAFLTALEEGASWPRDPRIQICLEWLKTHNTYLAPLVEAVILQHETAANHQPARGRQRL